MLLNPPDFPDIVHQLSTTIRALAVRRERAKKLPDHHRISATVSFESARTVDQFHNSCAGYRAQFLSSPALGDEANALVIAALLPHVLHRLEQFPLRRWDATHAQTSLRSDAIKAWIRQGHWLWHARGHCEELLVPNWIARSKDSDERVRRRVRYGRQLPGNTDAIVIKGAWVDALGSPASSPPKSRSERSDHIHRDGFT